jgi:hypothetical protein
MSLTHIHCQKFIGKKVQIQYYDSNVIIDCTVMSVYGRGVVGAELVDSNGKKHRASIIKKYLYIKPVISMIFAGRQISLAWF